MNLRTITPRTLLALLVIGLSAEAHDLPTRLYSAPWPTHHRDFRNSDYTPFPVATSLEKAWTALDGQAIITAPTIGPDGTIYVTTGSETTGNLHAFTRFGRKLWTHPDIDAKAQISSPVIDERGTIYVTDRDEMWAVNPDGTTRWKNLVPAPFATALLLGSNSVGGVTLLGFAISYNRDTGLLNAIPVKLPGEPPPTPTNLIALLEGVVDPSVIDSVLAGLLGFGTLVANTPAIHPNGTTVIIATGDGFLHGIHMAPGDIRPLYRVPIGTDSGTSPAISPDGNNVYVCDGEGFFHCHDPLTGALKYKLLTGRTFASPSIDENGVVYIGSGKYIYAIRDGIILWKNSLQTIANQLVAPGFYNGQRLLPRTQASSALSITPRHVIFQADVGYPFDLITGGEITSPRWTGLITLDRRTGRVTAPPLPLRDTGGAVVTLNADGRVYCPHGSITTTLATQLLNPILPRFSHFPQPTGGLTVLRPRDPASLMREQISTATRWMTDISRQLDAQNAGEADRLRQQTTTLLRGTYLVLSDAVAKRQIAINEAVKMGATLTAAEQELLAISVENSDALRAAANKHRLALAGLRLTRW
jgi:outer membrane protein assembly factor BamB